MRSKILAVALTVASLAASTVAFAAPTQTSNVAQRAENGDKSEKKFPMPAAEFKAKVDGKLSRARQHMETRAAKLDADKAKEVRERFDSGAAKVNAEVAKATADGTVTKEEAKDVFTAMRAMHPNHGKGHKREKKTAS
ncbi:MAG TPA: hypothetical protein VIF62_30380 [Labilithrix sp.]|jgi:hypothetical protein